MVEVRGWDLDVLVERGDEEGCFGWDGLVQLLWSWVLRRIAQTADLIPLYTRMYIFIL